MKLPIRFCILFLLGCCYMQAQQLQTNYLKPYNEEKIQSYISEIKNKLIIYSGKEERVYPNYLVNHPYLDTDEYRIGTLCFDGLIYPDVKMRLNQHQDQLIVLSPDQRYNIIISDELIDYAIIDSLYIFCNKSGKQNTKLPEGYIVRLYGGKYPVVKKERFLLERTIEDRDIKMSFTKRTRYYICVDGVYHAVGSKGSVLKLFKSNKKQLNQFIKENKLNFRRSPELAIVSVVKYVETLNK